jgi:hypothetical protein
LNGALKGSEKFKNCIRRRFVESMQRGVEIRTYRLPNFLPNCIRHCRICDNRQSLGYRRLLPCSDNHPDQIADDSPEFLKQPILPFLIRHFAPAFFPAFFFGGLPNGPAGSSHFVALQWGHCRGLAIFDCHSYPHRKHF